VVKPKATTLSKKSGAVQVRLQVHSRTPVRLWSIVEDPILRRMAERGADAEPSTAGETGR
jgi:hypothetical protein